MKLFTSLFLFCLLSFVAGAQGKYTAIGVGYSVANLNQPQFSDMLAQVNNTNPTLTSPFTSEDIFQGYNIWLGFRGAKTLFTLQYSRLSNHYKAEGVIPAISPNSATYNIGSHHTGVAMQLDYFPVRLIGIGLETGYTYSVFKNEQKDLFFGETKAVVDKKGGLHAGANLILQIPLGHNAFIQLQPFYTLALYKNDMNNVAAIYLGQNNTAAAETSLNSYGANVKLGIKIN